MRAANEPLSKLQMLELYRLEKLAMDDPLEPFPSFADWKKEYCDEFMSRSHHRKPVDLETLIEETDREVEEADLVLLTDEGETEMTDTNVDQAKRDAKNARRRELRAAAKASTVTSTASPKVRAARTGTKSEAAAKIFASMYPAHPRSEIIAKFQSKVGLSPAGSSTYYQKLLSRAKA